MSAAASRTMASSAAIFCRVFCTIAWAWATRAAA